MDLLLLHSACSTNIYSSLVTRRRLYRAVCEDRAEDVEAVLAVAPSWLNDRIDTHRTMLWHACHLGSARVAQLLLERRLVYLGHSVGDEDQPLYEAVRRGHLGVVKHFIASGRRARKCSLGGTGFPWRTCDEYDYALFVASHTGQEEIQQLLVRSMVGDGGMVRELRAELGLDARAAARIYALVVFHCDGLLRLREAPDEAANKKARFFRIAGRLPVELQAVLCNRVAGSVAQGIPSKQSERAFRGLAWLLCRGR